MATYSFLSVTAAIVGPGGGFTIGGDGTASADEGITVEMIEDKNTMTVGADGSVMHSLHGGKAGTATIRLLKTSPTNALLQGLYVVQTADALLHGQNVIMVSDLARGDVVACREVAFKRAPALNYGKEGGINEWVFDVGKVDTILGVGALT